MSYKERLNKLGLTSIKFIGVKDNEDCIIITISGGSSDFNNLSNKWDVYLEQIQEIIVEFNAWVIDLINNDLNNNWTLRIGTMQ